MAAALAKAAWSLLLGLAAGLALALAALGLLVARPLSAEGSHVRLPKHATGHRPEVARAADRQPLLAGLLLNMAGAAVPPCHLAAAGYHRTALSTVGQAAAAAAPSARRPPGVPLEEATEVRNDQ